VAGNEVVDLVQQSGKALNLVHHNPRAGRMHFDSLSKQARRTQHRKVVVVEQQVEPQSVAKVTSQPGRLSRRTGSEEKK
jgi:hypothetical protein